jgi:hypothetical protein
VKGSPARVAANRTVTDVTCCFTVHDRIAPARPRSLAAGS